MVYITTHKIIKAAFDDWMGQLDPEDKRQGLYPVFLAFMETPEAQQFHKVSGLIVFSLFDFDKQFRRWIKKEIVRVPRSEDNIRYYTETLMEHLKSEWCKEHKLILVWIDLTHQEM